MKSFNNPKVNLQEVIDIYRKYEGDRTQIMHYFFSLESKDFFSTPEKHISSPNRARKNDNSFYDMQDFGNEENTRIRRSFRLKEKYEKQKNQKSMAERDEIGQKKVC